MKHFKKTVLILFLILLFGAMPIIVWADAWEKDNDESSRMEKTKCTRARMKTIWPKTTSVGNKIAIRGHGFGGDPGEVIFNKNVPAKVISWSTRRIWVLVPEGAVTGNIKVIKTCPSGSFAVSQYIKIEKPKSE